MQCCNDLICDATNTCATADPGSGDGGDGGGDGGVCTDPCEEDCDNSVANRIAEPNETGDPCTPDDPGESMFNPGTLPKRRVARVQFQTASKDVSLVSSARLTGVLLKIWHD